MSSPALRKRKQRTTMFLVLVVATCGGIFWPLLPTEQTVSLTVSWEHVVGTSESAKMLALLATTLLALAGFLWPRMTKEREVGAPVVFSPPEGLGPVQTVHCTWETTGQHAVASSLLHLRNLGLVTIDQAERGTLRFTRTASADEWKRADRITRFVGEQVGLTDVDTTMEPSLGRRAKSEFASVDSATLEAVRNWSRHAGLSRIGVPQFIGRSLWWSSLLAAAALFTGVAGPTVYGLPFAAFVLAGFAITEVGYLHVRTPDGRRQWAHAKGFSRFLSTPSNEARIAYSVDKKMQPGFMAYALAFGVAASWQESFLGLSPSLQTAAESSLAVDEAIQEPTSDV